MSLTADDLLAELHIDDTERAAVERAMTTASEYVRSAVDYNIAASVYESEPMYDALIVALVTQLYFDKELSTGLSRGALMLLIQLKARLGVY